MDEWKQAQASVLARLSEVKRLIDGHDEGGALALINQQDAFCEQAGKVREQAAAPGDESQCHFCEGFRQSGGCHGRLEQIDEAVTSGDWQRAGELVDEYAAWVRSLNV